MLAVAETFDVPAQLTIGPHRQLGHGRSNVHGGTFRIGAHDIPVIIKSKPACDIDGVVDPQLFALLGQSTRHLRPLTTFRRGESFIDVSEAASYSLHEVWRNTVACLPYARNILRDVIATVADLHRLGYVYGRRLASRKFVVFDDQGQFDVRLTDFGLARSLTAMPNDAARAVAIEGDARRVRHLLGRVMDQFAVFHIDAHLQVAYEHVISSLETLPLRVVLSSFLLPFRPRKSRQLSNKQLILFIQTNSSPLLLFVALPNAWLSAGNNLSFWHSFLFMPEIPRCILFPDKLPVIATG
jgi:hypothetical protein